jgi:group I intron endonuclease
MPDVYLIRNLVSGKAYVGGTFNSVSWAWKWHVRLSKSDSANLLQKDIRKYGQDSFEVKILYPNLPLKFLDEMIEYGRRVFRSTDPQAGYNLRRKSAKSSRPAGRPKMYRTPAERKRAYAERMRAYRQRKALRDGRIYGQRWSKHKPKRAESS